MLIENYYIDNKKYFSLPQNLRCDFFSLEVKFICLSKVFIRNLEAILKKYHILINQILCANYIKTFKNENHSDIFTTASKLVSGYNNNDNFSGQNIKK